MIDWQRHLECFEREGVAACQQRNPIARQQIIDGNVQLIRAGRKVVRNLKVETQRHNLTRMPGTRSKDAIQRPDKVLGNSFLASEVVELRVYLDISLNFLGGLPKERYL